MKLRKINIKFLTLALVMLLIVGIANIVVPQVELVWIIYIVVFLAGISTYWLKGKSWEWKMHYAYTVIALLISQLTVVFTIGDPLFCQKIALILSLALFISGIFKQKSTP